MLLQKKLERENYQKGNPPRKNSKSKSGRGAGGSRVTRKGNKRLPKRECGVRGAHGRIDREVGCVQATVEPASGY